MKQNPILHTRRRFLKTSILGGALSWTLPAFIDRTFHLMASEADGALVQGATGRDDTILVLLQLAGGNDGLNTVIPYTDDAYYRARPGLAIAPESGLKLNDQLALHPALKNLRNFFDQGELGLIQGVGYPNPNRSHFRSMEIWQTATDSNQTAQQGWLGRYFDNCCQGQEPTVGISISGQAPQAFASKEGKGVSFSQPEIFRFGQGENDQEAGMDGGSIGMLAGGLSSSGDALDFLQRTEMDAEVSSDKILAITKKVPVNKSYPNSRLGQSLSLVSRLIAGGMPTRVYYVSQGGYDTHSNQKGSHERLMTELDLATASFIQDMREQGNLRRVLLMTFSEFGRRVSENASGGTDHGAAAPLFVMGGAVRPGFYGRQPSLTDLHQGDLVYNVDFRSVYASILENWLRADSQTVLGRQFEKLPFIG